MSKAILVLKNMPKTCIECPLSYKAELVLEGNFLYRQLYRCKVEPEDVEDCYLPNILKEKPEWCPLYLQEQSKESLSMSNENVSVVNVFLRDNRKLQTNMDRIRAMSEEELAAVLMCPYDVDETSFGEKIPCYQNDRQELVTEEECRKCCVNWLKSGVKE